MGASLSPVPNEAVKVDLLSTVSFYDALKAAMVGKKATKLEWKNSNEYFLISDERLKIHHAMDPDEKLYDFVLRECDIDGSDYRIL